MLCNINATTDAIVQMLKAHSHCIQCYYCYHSFKTETIYWNDELDGLMKDSFKICNVGIVLAFCGGRLPESDWLEEIRPNKH